MKDSKQLPDASSPTGITPRSVNLVTRISNHVVGMAEDPELRGPVYLDCLIRSHADCFGVAQVSQEQLAEEAGVTARCIRKWLKVAEERFGYKVTRHPWTDERGRQVNEYWMSETASWSLVPTAMLRLPNVPYQSKLLLCTMARVSEDKRGSRMPTTLAKLTGYSKPKDVWKWIQPVRSLVELWREGDSKKIFWSLPGGLDMDMDRILSPDAGPQVTWAGLQDQAPLVPLDPTETGTASSSTEDPLRTTTTEDASCDAFQDQHLQEEDQPPGVVYEPEVVGASLKRQDRKKPDGEELTLRCLAVADLLRRTRGEVAGGPVEGSVPAEQPCRPAAARDAGETVGGGDPGGAGGRGSEVLVAGEDRAGEDVARDQAGWQVQAVRGT